MKSSLMLVLLLLTATHYAAVPVLTVKQQTIRPSYPFPLFLSTGPYIWYDDAKNKPIKGHTYRIATFSENQTYSIFVEKVEFGDGGCCLEIVDYRELFISESFLSQHYPNNKGIHGFKLIRWITPTIFEFHAYGGKYRLSHIDNVEPLLEEIATQ